MSFSIISRGTQKFISLEKIKTKEKFSQDENNKLINIYIEDNIRLVEKYLGTFLVPTRYKFIVEQIGDSYNNETFFIPTGQKLITEIHSINYKYEANNNNISARNITSSNDYTKLLKGIRVNYDDASLNKNLFDIVVEATEGLGSNDKPNSLIVQCIEDLTAMDYSSRGIDPMVIEKNKNIILTNRLLSIQTGGNNV